MVTFSSRGDGTQAVEMTQSKACGEGVTVGEVLGELLVEEGSHALARLFLGCCRDLDGRDRDETACTGDDAGPADREHPIALVGGHDAYLLCSAWERIAVVAFIVSAFCEWVERRAKGPSAKECH